MSGSVYTKLAVELSDMQAGMSKARGEVKAYKDFAKREGAGIGTALFSGIGAQASSVFGGLLGKLGLAGGVLGIANTIHGAIEEYSKLADLAARFDATPLSLQKLDVHAKLTGTSVESLVTGVQKLQRALADPGDPKVAAAMEDLKLSAVDLAGLQPDQQLERLAAAFNEAQLAGRGFDRVFDLMGRSAGEMIPALREFAANKERIASISFLKDSDVRALKQVGDTMALLWSGTKAGAAKLLLHPIDTLSGKIPQADLDEQHKRDVERMKKEGAPRELWDDSIGAEAGGTFSGLASAFEEFTSPESLKLWTARFKAQLDIQKSEMAKQASDAERIASAKKALADEEALAAEGALSALGQIEAHKERILEKEKEIAALQGPGADMEVARLRLMQERVRLIGETAQKIESAEKAAAQAANNKKELDRREKEILAEISDLTPREPRLPGSLAQSLNRLGGRSSGELQLDETRKQTNKLAKLEGLLREIRDKNIPAPIVNVDGTPRF